MKELPEIGAIIKVAGTTYEVTDRRAFCGCAPYGRITAGQPNAGVEVILVSEKIEWVR